MLNRKCKTCGHSEAILKDLSGFGTTDYQVICPVCGEEGSVEETRVNAIKDWNENYSARPEKNQKGED